jgi:myosin heavy chain 6/7
MILAPAIMQAESDPKIAAAKCLEAVELDPESYRVGHTKVQSEPLKPLARIS